MAAALATQAFGERAPDFEVKSAGLLLDGLPATEEAKLVMSERGLDLSRHKSRSLENAVDPPPDLILAMEAAHIRRISRFDQDLAAKAFTLKGFVRFAGRVGPRRSEEPLPAYLSRVAASGEKPARGDAISDPIGRGILEYERCAAELERLIDALADLL